jgi:hypothetical protein
MAPLLDCKRPMKSGKNFVKSISSNILTLKQEKKTRALQQPAKVGNFIRLATLMLILNSGSIGIARLKENLECVDWNADNYSDVLETYDSLLQENPDDSELDLELAQMDVEFRGLKGALLRDTDDAGEDEAPEGIENLEVMMAELLAIKGRPFQSDPQRSS